MDEYIGTIKIFAFNFPPRYWTTCDGQLMSIAQNQALFSLLGTVYGGNGTTTFGLPDLRCRTMVHCGTGPGLTNVVQGQKAGNQSYTLTANTMPQHVHSMVGASMTTVIHTAENGTVSNESDNGNNGFASGGSAANGYSEPPLGNTNSVGGATSTVSGSTSGMGGSQPFSLLNPFLAMYHCICLQGVFPSRN
jgi:microcystin-dependent protein